MTTPIMSTYARLPVRFSHGEGVWLVDEAGERYLDALSGISVCGLGHAHPAVARAVGEQAGRLIHTSNLYGIANQERLAEILVELSGMDSVFFANSGAEANEAAIKIARAYGHSRGVDVPRIAVFDGSFHGRTLATLSATGNPKVHAGFEPLVQGYVRVPYDDVEALEAIAADEPDLVAVLVEPVLGEGGVMIPAHDYLSRLRALCDARHWLLMLDEVQTGMGRTGRWFAHQHAGIVPDVMTLAKALGNGVPIGACLARGVAAEALKPGSHGSTFGGNPLACSAALAVLETMQREDLVGRAREQGERLQRRLVEALGGLNCVREVRGKGLMIGIELDRACAELVGRALGRHLLINVTADKVIRLLPPLIIGDDEIDTIAETLRELVSDWNAGA
ncbi:MAG: acetylornithine/succinylornithine family transaminase [Gammaproteobacteria bacterium]|nr:acetylornithine/succinylornithine family transaminase [Gammaproteobacteria bacterium]NIM73950.1 acetylornithine/succinylornithine family transaminase [Gammaproteobacteria bacterium]NIN38138.1 acetylornithine/succinylornithine family transaminase [Gammaproteobacteria bacterium]NIO25731.1 acetylornithine/succinylornithine family transaminase [Gammaproteobacteria bacterium]NIO66365.1 acetylornithine/succinylornithine family transaminase [Gammaproteobacteria bacterium]